MPKKRRNRQPRTVHVSMSKMDIFARRDAVKEMKENPHIAASIKQLQEKILAQASIIASKERTIDDLRAQLGDMQRRLNRG